MQLKLIFFPNIFHLQLIKSSGIGAHGHGGRLYMGYYQWGPWSVAQPLGESSPPVRCTSHCSPHFFRSLCAEIAKQMVSGTDSTLARAAGGSHHLLLPCATPIALSELKETVKVEMPRFIFNSRVSCGKELITAHQLA